MTKLRVNILSISGAVLGLAAIFLVWLYDVVCYCYPTPGYNLFSIIFSDNLGFGLEFKLCSLIILISSCAAFISPIAGVPLGFGNLLFLSFYYIVPYADWQFDFGLGFYLSIVASITILISFIKPIGIGYRKEPISIKEKLINFGGAS